MNNRFLVRLFWGERRETAAECAHRFKTSLERLAQLAPEFQQWYQGINGPGQANEEHHLDHTQLTRFIEEGRDTVAPPKMADELGFSVRTWYSYGDDELGKLIVHCGGYNHGPYGPFNSVILNLPDVNPRLELDEIFSILRALIEIWEPSWANIWNDEIMDAVPELEVDAPEMGWMLFLENERGPLPELGEAFKVVQIDSGNIIITGEEPPSSERNDGIKHLHQLHSELMAAGVLGPVND